MSDKQIETCQVQDYLPVNKLKLHDMNPRMITADRMRDLKLSIVHKGFYEPILVTKKKVVLSGNHRVLAARQLIEEGFIFKSMAGDNMLPVVIEDVSDEVAEAIIFDTNNSYADWVEEKLQAALLEAQAAGKNLREFGFTDDAIQDLLKTSLKECETMAEREGKDYDTTKAEPKEDDRAPVPESDALEAWLLPVELHGRLIDVFMKMDKAFNPHRGPNDSVYPTVEKFCDVFEQAGFMDDLVELMDGKE